MEGKILRVKIENLRGFSWRFERAGKKREKKFMFYV